MTYIRPALKHLILSILAELSKLFYCSDILYRFCNPWPQPLRGRPIRLTGRKTDLLILFVPAFAIRLELEGLPPGEHPGLVPGDDGLAVPVKGLKRRILVIGDGRAIEGLAAAELLVQEAAGAAAGPEILAPDLVVGEIGVEADLPALDARAHTPPPKHTNEANLTPQPPIQQARFSACRQTFLSKAPDASILLPDN